MRIYLARRWFARFLGTDEQIELPGPHVIDISQIPDDAIGVEIVEVSGLWKSMSGRPSVDLRDPLIGDCSSPRRIARYWFGKKETKSYMDLVDAGIIPRSPIPLTDWVYVQTAQGWKHLQPGDVVIPSLAVSQTQDVA